MDVVNVLPGTCPISPAEITVTGSLSSAQAGSETLALSRSGSVVIAYIGSISQACDSTIVISNPVTGRSDTKLLRLLPN